ncbi:MAG: AAA family ATPase [Candidatus Symbiothrix sp.]|jgi:predicted AAA+ superfamily ATPase|nr:AAA family ATPase [Candidatus Symbiothrix sp.]
MDSLFRNSARVLNAVTLHYHRYIYDSIDWDSRLICITGPRGTGKTTLMLQYIKENFLNRDKALYVSLDNIWFTQNSLIDLAEKFYNYGGTHLFIDEVHRYPTWSIEIKNIYDSFPDMHVVFTGSSILKIYQSGADLSRRVINYNLSGLSFREYLLFEHKLDFPVISLIDLLKNHASIASEITSKVKILPEFKRYLEYGYYPFYKEGLKTYLSRLQNVVNTILDSDLPAVEPVEYATIQKIKKMLMILSSLVPYTPNINQLSGEIESNRANTIKYLGYLERAGLIKMLSLYQKGMGLLTKPEKIYLDNTNLLYALTNIHVNIGNVRETFFANQLSVKHAINTSKQGDFQVDGKWLFEIGGSRKTFDQIKDLEDSYIAVDEVETGHGHKIPLWLFGFTY